MTANSNPYRELFVQTPANKNTIPFLCRWNWHLWQFSTDKVERQCQRSGCRIRQTRSTYYEWPFDFSSHFWSEWLLNQGDYFMIVASPSPFRNDEVLGRVKTYRQAKRIAKAYVSENPYSEVQWTFVRNLPIHIVIKAEKRMMGCM